MKLFKRYAKAIFVISAISLLFTVCFGCSSQPEAAPEPDEWGITLTVKKAKTTGATIVCKQEGGEHSGTFEYGNPYAVERYTDGEWTPVEFVQDNIAWTMPAFMLPEG